MATSTAEHESLEQTRPLAGRATSVRGLGLGPHLRLEAEATPGSIEQLNVRVQSFVEPLA